jgi:carboxyl-terminal processing protease
MALTGISPADRVVMALPAADPVITAALPLIRNECAEFEAALGVPVAVEVFGSAEEVPDSDRIVWRFSYDASAVVAQLEWRRDDRSIVSRARDGSGLLRSLNLLHMLVRSRCDVVRDEACTSIAEVCDRVVTEVGGSYPAFGLRGLDWAALSAVHQPAVIAAAGDPLPALQRWLAELGDAHTWVHQSPRPSNPPYALAVDGDDAVLRRVSAGSAGFEAGARPGWHLVGEDPRGWWSRTGAPAHVRPLVAGRRMIAVPDGDSRPMTARAPDGQTVSWLERAPAARRGDVVTWQRLDAGVGYLSVTGWVRDMTVGFDAALTELASCDRLVLDLRGNTGGNLMAALLARDRFVRRETVMGSIRYSDGVGGLAEPAAIVALPSDDVRWAGELVVLTDPLTYSASEDFLLGLAGLDHVRVLGEPTGGGSGRPRTLPLLPGLELSVSTALTYDRDGRCIENAGIQPDVVAAHPPADEPGQDSLVHAALRM